MTARADAAFVEHIAGLLRMAYGRSAEPLAADRDVARHVIAAVEDHHASEDDDGNALERAARASLADLHPELAPGGHPASPRPAEGRTGPSLADEAAELRHSSWCALHRDVFRGHPGGWSIP